MLIIHICYYIKIYVHKYWFGATPTSSQRLLLALQSKITPGRLRRPYEMSDLESGLTKTKQASIHFLCPKLNNF